MSAMVEGLLALLHWVAGVSYFKAAAPPAVAFDGPAPGPAGAVCRYWRNAGIFSPAIMCSKVSRALMSSKALPLTSTSAAIPRVL